MGGGLGASAPDWIEPADDPNHRGGGHSLVVLGISGGPIVALAASDQVLSLPVVAQLRQRVRERKAEFLAASEAATERWRKVWFLGLAHLVHPAAGFLVGVPAGYASHLALDAFSRRSIPLLKKGF